MTYKEVARIKKLVKQISYQAEQLTLEPTAPQERINVLVNCIVDIEEFLNRLSSDSRLRSIEFEIGEMVYLKTDPNQLERIVTGITIRENSISYSMSAGIEDSYHYGFEITRNRNELKALNA